MRVTLVLPPVDMSGGIRVAALHARALQETGHAVRVVSPPHRARSPRDTLGSLLSGRGWRSVRRSCASHLDGSGLDHRVLESHRAVTDDDVPDADVVIATWWETAEWVAALRPEKGAKVYFIQHHEVFEYLPAARSRATYLLPMHKIVVSRWLRDLMRTEYGDELVDLVPNSVAREQFFAAERGKQATPTVGFLYATAGFKRLAVCLRALAGVRARVPHLRLVCFGSEHPRPELPLPSGTEFIFSPAQNRIREIYAACDVWVSASYTEGFNLPAMEAMACRTPVVATNTGWPAEAIKTGENGVLVEVDDVEGIRSGIEWVLSLADDEWRALSRRAHATTCSSSWEESSRRFEKALFHACRRSANGEFAGSAVLQAGERNA